MSIPRSKSRAINVDHQAFRYMLGSGGGHLMGMSGPGITLTVQEDVLHPGRVMQVRVYSKAYAAQDAYREEHDGVKSRLLPRDVARAIQYALDKGWDPKEKGVPFTPAGPLDLGEYELPAPF